MCVCNCGYFRSRCCSKRRTYFLKGRRLTWRDENADNNNDDNEPTECNKFSLKHICYRLSQSVRRRRSCVRVAMCGVCHVWMIIILVCVSCLLARCSCVDPNAHWTNTITEIWILIHTRTHPTNTDVRCWQFRCRQMLNRIIIGKGFKIVLERFKKYVLLYSSD